MMLQQKTRSMISRGLVLLAVASTAGAQDGWDCLRFQPFRSSDPAAFALFDGSTGNRVAFRPGFWVEVDLTPDEEGRAPLLWSNGTLNAYVSQGTQAVARLLLRPEYSPSWQEQWRGTLYSGSNSVSIPTFMRVRAIRLEAVSVTGSPPELEDFYLYATTNTRTFDAIHVGWYAGPPAPGTATALILMMRIAANDRFLLLFWAGGSPLLATPIRIDPAWAGGLLLDPSTTTVLKARPVSGPTNLYESIVFPWDPALAGTRLHLQGVAGDFYSFTRPILSWTRPITLPL